MGGTVCDGCGTLIPSKEVVKVHGKKRELHYCNEDCKAKHHTPRKTKEAA